MSDDDHRTPTITRAGVTIRYRNTRLGVAFILKELCLVCDAPALVEDVDEADDRTGRMPSHLAIGKKSGRIGSGNSLGDAYTSLLFNIVEAIQFFVVEAKVDPKQFVKRPLHWSEHRIWKAGGKDARKYLRLSSISEELEAHAIGQAQDLIATHLNITASSGLLKSDELAETVFGQMVDMEADAIRR